MALPWRLVCLACVVSSGCSLLLDTSSFTDGAGPPGGTADGGDAGIGLPADASTDSAAGDARQCDATFCDDFDQGALGSTWNRIELGGGGTIEDETTVLVSPPRAFRAKAPAAAQSSTAYLERILPTGTGVRCSFSFRPNLSPAGADHHIDFAQLIATGPGVDGYVLLLSVRAPGTGIREDVTFVDGGCGCPRRQLVIPATLPTSRWSTVTIDTNFIEVLVSVDGAPVSKERFIGFVPTTLGLRLGLENRSNINADVQYDNLVCAVTP
jgi:hypothetical protein